MIKILMIKKILMKFLQFKISIGFKLNLKGSFQYEIFMIKSFNLKFTLHFEINIGDINL